MSAMRAGRRRSYTLYKSRAAPDGIIKNEFTIMSEKDKRLIDEAKGYSIFDWDKVMDLAGRAETAEGRRRLREIAVEYNHREEALNDNI